MKPSKLEQTLHSISYQPKHRLELFRQLLPRQQALVILRTSKHLQKDIVSKLPQAELLVLLEQLDPDQATDMLSYLPAQKQTKILGALSDRLKNHVTFLLQFDPESAAGLMSIDYIHAEVTDTFGQVLAKLERHEKRTGRVPTVLAFDQGQLKGFLPGRILALGQKNQSIATHIKKIATVHHQESHSQVANLFRHHPHNKVAVLGDQKNVIGLIYSDDILRLLQSQQASSLYDFAGVSDEESIYDSTRRKIQSRYKWLIINLGTSFLAAFTVGLFDETISRHVLLAVYMPIVAGMGGNAGTQTLAVLVRGLAHKIPPRQVILTTLKNELGSGLVNGLINGAIVTIIVWLFNRNLGVGLVLGAAMITNMLIAAFFGTLVPVVMKSLGKDPASSATIFITTATDVFGFLAFLGLATVILG